MKFSKIAAVYKKESRDILRDRRTLISMILIPILLYPLLFSIIGQIMSAGAAKLEREQNIIVVKAGAPAPFLKLIRDDEKLQIVYSENPEADLFDGKIAAIVEVSTVNKINPIRLIFDAAVDRSRIAKKRIDEIFNQYKLQEQQLHLQEKGIEPSEFSAFGVSYINTASPSRMGGGLFVAIIPMLLIVTLALGAMYPAIDLTAGEKERGTLETILTVPISRTALLIGKYLTVFTIGLITGILNLLSMISTYSLGLIQLGIISGKLDFALSPQVIVILFIMLIPLALFVSAAILGVSLFARSFKDAQNLITPFYLLLIFPTFFALTPGIELNMTLALIPILNVCLLFKELLLGNFQYDLIFAVFLSNALFAFTGFLILSRLFNAEKILFAEGKGFHFAFNPSKMERRKTANPSEAMLLFAVIMMLQFYLGSLLPLKFSIPGFLGMQVLLIFLPVMAFIWFGKLRFKSALNLKGFHSAALFGTILISFGGLHIVAWLAQLQATLFPESLDAAEALESVLNFEKSGFQPVTALLLFALTPAICEEIIFRGVLLSSFKTRMTPAAAILLTGLLFGISHMSIFRIMPTALLGIYLTYITYRTGSIYLAMLGHAINNAIALGVVLYPQVASSLPWLTDLTRASPLLVISAILLIATGTLLVGVTGKRVPRKVSTRYSIELIFGSKRTGTNRFD
ncbi:CPBP family intramembrane metalloprotease [candidate division KSB1 bacterium]|nr:CPBP family intramembrane metalloprotease [candidate division KSB1 bacterium]